MSKATLTGLRVAKHKGWYDSTWTEYERATVSDLIDALRELGAETVDAGDVTGWLEDWVVTVGGPGTYLVYRLEPNDGE